MNEQRAFSPQAKADLLDKVCDLVHSRVPAEEREDASRFVRHFFRDVPPGDLAQHDAEELYGAAISYWKYAAKRAPGTPKIQVYNPTVEAHGWKSVHTIVEIVTGDMPFLVDSVTAAINGLGLTVHLVIHPIAAVRRDEKGVLREFHESAEVADGYEHESWMLFQIDEQTGADVLNKVRDRIGEVLTNVRAAVEDWKPMVAHARALLETLGDNPPKLPADEVEEGRAFVDWMLSDNFTFLGYRAYRIEAEGGNTRIRMDADSGLGILRNPDFHVFEGARDAARLPPDTLKFLTEPKLLVISKANTRASVHRAVHLDVVGFKTFDDSGAVIGEIMFVGLFTSEVYYRSPYNIPYVRRKLYDVQKQAGFRPRSHDAKALEHILATYPRDELFQIDVRDLHRIVIGILHLQERQRVAFFERIDPFQRFASCLVFAPRDGFSTALRESFVQVLERAYDGEAAAFDTQLSQDQALARIHLIIKTTPGEMRRPDPAEVEAQLAEAARSWSDRLRDALIESHGEEAGLHLARRYGEAFPSNYRESVAPQAAMADVDKLEMVLDTGDLGLNMYRPLEADESEFRFKVYNRGQQVPLSDILPTLENMGVRVIDEVPFHVTPDGASPIWIHDFGLLVEDLPDPDLNAVRDSFHECFIRTWRGDMENDGFNRLALGARLGWRQIVMLRAYAKYLRQAGIPFSQHYVQETLGNNIAIVAWLIDLFEARFTPPKAKGERIVNEIVSQIEMALEDVSSLDEDRIIRRYVNVILATLRTNFFQHDADGMPKAHLSFKVDSAAVEDLPLPRPMFEIWVYSPRVEGVHLRFGKVARGGLRWSDRREDFRTEVLGLVKAQVVKNAVIVPVGSKGGFVVKRPPPGGDRAAQLDEGIECYKTFIRGMLDVTDNLKSGDVVAPRDVVCHDGDDPYLVVAADKGTASFSDIANEVSAEYGFWLDDAFASGGSAGYDHKEMGITARGAWEAVKRHFREIGKDIQNEDFSVVGVGDMSGDVFGNGMLLSKHIRLIGAFNHLHIFVDPDPDREESWRERQRLYELGRGSWNEYDARLISQGGGVFSRSAKSVDVTPEMQRLFGLSDERVTPNALIHAMLKTEVELLWFGGIGTYVKASDETHAEVGDRVNDALRVDGRALNAMVIGEGANLALTQRGRIEFGLAGGRLNTDAIDNSAGVDCSDHEVNIKILLRDVLDAGDMTMKQRNALLEDMTEEVAQLVLRDNYLQTGSLSVTESIAPRLLDRHVRFMRTLEREGRLDRNVEFLPNEEAIEDRRTAGRGLSRPEIAVLLAYAKIELFDALVESDLPDDPALAADLIDYFPTPLRKKYKSVAKDHRLRREIIATRVTNDLINRAGITFIHDIGAETGYMPADIARAYIITREALALTDVWLDTEALDNQVAADTQIKVFHRTGQLVKRLTGWFLRHGTRPLDVRAQINGFKPGIKAFSDALPDMLPEAHRELLDSRTDHFAGLGLPKDLARRVGSFEFLLSGCDVVRLADQTGADLTLAGAVYFRIGDLLEFDWLRDAAIAIPPDNYWDKLAVTAVVDELYSHQSALARSALAAVTASDSAKKSDPDELVADWQAGQSVHIDRALALIDDIRNSGTPDLAMIAVANRQISTLLA